MAYDVVSLIPGFCEIFRGNGNFEDGGMVYWDQIDPSSYDYSVGSLAQVDLYLSAVRGAKDTLEWQTYTNMVLATGAYVGEVLRRHSEREWIWMNYDQFEKAFPNLAEATGLTEDLNTAAILVGDGEMFVLPFNKIMRFLEEGPENSTLAFYEAFYLRPVSG